MSIEAKKRKKPVVVTDQMILDLLKEQPDSSASMLAAHFNVSDSIMFAKLNNLVSKEEIAINLLYSIKGRGIRHYRLADKTIAPVKEETKEVMTNTQPEANTQPEEVIVQKPIPLFTSKSTALSLDTLITEAAHNIAQKMLMQIKEELMMGLEDLVLEVAPKITRDGFLNKAPKEKVTKPKVLITGLLSHQAGIISSEFYEFFDLDFWNDRTGGSTEQLKSMAKRADVILYHKNHASHNHQEIIKSVGGNMKIVNGGITSMKDALTDLYVNGVK